MSFQTLWHGPYASLQRSLQRRFGSERLLDRWYRRQAARPLPARDHHVFPAPLGDPGADATCLFLHAPSGLYGRLDPLAADLLRLTAVPQDRARERIPALAARHSRAALRQALRTDAASRAVLAQRTTPPPPTDEPTPVKGELLMYGTLTCNMACPYCSSRQARADAAAGRLPREMPLETAQQSLRFLAERLADQAEHVYINFTLGGEPLLARAFFDTLRAYGEQVSAELGLPITLNINTNGTLFSEAVLRYCEENAVHLAVSLDGPRDIHDPLRPFVSGRGTYDTIVRALPRVLQSPCFALRNVAAGAVLTAQNPFPQRVYQHLIELGFRHVVVTPVRDDPAHPWSLNAETVDAFRQGYTEYAAWLLECLVREDDRIYAALIEHDFFGRYLLRVLRGTKQPYRCEAGRTTFGVGVDGDLYPCDHFIRLADYRLGDVFRGLDPDRQAAFLEDTLIDRKPVCRDCWARYLCGGGCYYTAALAHGDHRRPYAPKCDLIRHCVELAIGLVAELERRHPQALQRLTANVCQATAYDVAPGLSP